jgi:hypothetical protein
MALIAESELTISGPIEAVFSQFVDYPRWRAWMPASFRPMRGPSRPLRAGDRLIIRITGLPSIVHVDRVEWPREVCWSGGLSGVMHARHTFTFEAVGDKTTRIRSTEPWTGAVTKVKPLADRIHSVAERVGRSQLEGFGRWFSQEFDGSKT